MSSAPRRPAAFRVEPEPIRDERPEAVPEAPRRPRALRVDSPAVVLPAEIDVFDEIDDALAVPPPPVAPRRRSRLGRIFLSALGAVLSLAVGLWIDALIRDLFSRADWLGWTAVAVVAVALLSLFLIVARELIALRRLASVEKMRARAVEATTRNDQPAARRLVDELAQFVSAKPETAAGRRMLAELRDDVIDGGDLIRLAETELLAPLDERARSLVLDAAKRVSIVTAVSPRALVDLAYVVFEAARLIRRLSELYGARPGTLGFFRLLRSVLAHLAVTGSIAAGDSFVQQIIGHGLAARLSAKLGEGVVNGMMTARIGIAAIESTRPLPFGAVKRPGLSDILAVLTQFSTRAGGKSGEPRQ
jgi:putative membrane protein